jgi:tetratricopeptide (TPR) repeat protein
LTTNQWNIARDIFLEVIENDPTEGLAYAGLGFALQQLGQEEEAKTNMQIAAFLEPSSPLVLHTAGAITQQQSQIEDALQYFQLIFAQIDNKSYSSSHYYRIYYRFFLKSDMIPQLRRGELTSQMITDLNILAYQSRELVNRVNPQKFYSVLMQKLQIQNLYETIKSKRALDLRIFC